MSWLWWGLVSVWACCCCEVLARGWQPNKTNFLFIMFDDLRPELSIYGKPDMITPNFERLARKSVVFDYAFCQVAVCNPSRDSLLTGLRPDTVGTYGFQWTYLPHMTFPGLFTAAGYKTAGYGKIFHWDRDDKENWNYDHWDADWYTYQDNETYIMNSSVMADKIKPEEDFRDYIFTSRAISTMKELHSNESYFMLGLGFKLPHLQLHVPFKYFDMYRDKRHMWKRRRKELRFPDSAPVVSHKCCSTDSFEFMNNDGGEKYVKKENIGRINQPFTQQMHTELSWGYAAAITFLDAQLGRVLDAVNEMGIWDNLTIILTSDHGIHNGEKGMWHKWTTFDESTRVPLLISHPQSSFKGQRYSDPVELIDIFPTVVDLFPIAPGDIPCEKLHKRMKRCLPLQGKSLAPVVLGTPVGDVSSPSARYNEAISKKRPKKMRLWGVKKSKNRQHLFSTQMPSLGNDLFAVSQNWLCAHKEKLQKIQSTVVNGTKTPEMRDGVNPFFECVRVDNIRPEKTQEQVSVMGYTFRYADYRYTFWLHWNRVRNIPDIAAPIYAEELYDHRNETLEQFTHRELVNVVHQPEYTDISLSLRKKAYIFLNKVVKFRGPYLTYGVKNK